MGSFSTTWKHVRRSPYQAMAAILTLFLTILLLGIFSLTSVVSVMILEYFEGKPQITVFFADKGGKAEADVLTSALQATGKIAQTKFVSKDDALALYKEQNKNDPLLLEMVTADILPASLEITTTSPEYLAEVEVFVKKAQGVEEVVYQKDVVDSLVKWTQGIRVVLGVLVAILSFNAVLVIMLITSMKIAIKKEEIEILRLVGASRWYIRSPFIIEGGLYGILGAFLAWLTITGCTVWAHQVFLSFFGMVPALGILLENPLDPLFLVVSLSFLVILSSIGFFIGAFGSFVAVNRFLKI